MTDHPWPSPWVQGSRGVAMLRRFFVSPRFLWFLGLFLKCRHRIDAILSPLLRSLRYGRNGSCFVRFDSRLTLQSWENVEKCRRTGRTGDPAGGPLPWGVE